MIPKHTNETDLTSSILNKFGSRFPATILALKDTLDLPATQNHLDAWEIIFSKVRRYLMDSNHCSVNVARKTKALQLKHLNEVQKKEGETEKISKVGKGKTFCKYHYCNKKRHYRK